MIDYIKISKGNKKLEKLKLYKIIDMIVYYSWQKHKNKKLIKRQQIEKLFIKKHRKILHKDGNN